MGIVSGQYSCVYKDSTIPLCQIAEQIEDDLRHRSGTGLQKPHIPAIADVYEEVTSSFGKSFWKWWNKLSVWVQPIWYLLFAYSFKWVLTFLFGVFSSNPELIEKLASWLPWMN
jgi:hypothetical protein